MWFASNHTSLSVSKSLYTDRKIKFNFFVVRNLSAFETYFVRIRHNDLKDPHVCTIFLNSSYSTRTRTGQSESLQSAANKITWIPSIEVLRSYVMYTYRKQHIKYDKNGFDERFAAGHVYQSINPIINNCVILSPRTCFPLRWPREKRMPQWKPPALFP